MVATKHEGPYGPGFCQLTIIRTGPPPSQLPQAVLVGALLEGPLRTRGSPLVTPRQFHSMTGTCAASMMSGSLKSTTEIRCKLQQNHCISLVHIGYRRRSPWTAVSSNSRRPFAPGAYFFRARMTVGKRSVVLLAAGPSTKLAITACRSEKARQKRLGCARASASKARALRSPGSLWPFAL